MRPLPPEVVATQWRGSIELSPPDERWLCVWSVYEPFDRDQVLVLVIRYDRGGRTSELLTTSGTWRRFEPYEVLQDPTLVIPGHVVGRGDRRPDVAAVALAHLLEFLEEKGLTDGRD